MNFNSTVRFWTSLNYQIQKKYFTPNILPVANTSELFSIRNWLLLGNRLATESTVYAHVIFYSHLRGSYLPILLIGSSLMYKGCLKSLLFRTSNSKMTPQFLDSHNKPNLLKYMRKFRIILLWMGWSSKQLTIFHKNTFRLSNRQ